jgi:hypothetical protein
MLISCPSPSYTSKKRDKANEVTELKQGKIALFLVLSASLLIPLFVPEVHSEPEALSQRTVDYDIQVELDAEKKQLLGTEWVSWTNPGRKPVSDIYFHLYPNAFRSKESTFIRESGGRLRNDKMDEDQLGRMEIQKVQVMKGEDVSKTLTYVQPDDQNESDMTVAFVTLSKPVLPGEKVSLQIQFSVSLPKVFARMGYWDDFIMAGQWFPKLAVYEPVGRRGVSQEGWNAHQYHGNSEFYADYGTYQVSINVPDSYTVAATGFPIGQPIKKPNGTKTWKFAANDVHDFAWSASPHFVTAEKSFSNEQVPGVKIKLYLDPAHQHLKERYFKAAAVSLDRLSRWFGSYPYSTLSIIVPPKGAGGAAGMEYPTLVTGWDAKEAQPGESLERVIVHEIAHQYWYGMIGTNEFEEAWLDEGFTSYTEDKIMADAYGSPSYHPFEAVTVKRPEPLAFPSWHYSNYNSYASNVYTRGKLVLFAIEHQIGEHRMKQILSTYFHRWQFGHPNTRDFLNVLEQETRRDWTAFFNAYVYGSSTVDYEVTHIEVRPIEEQGKTVYESLVWVEQKGGAYPSVPLEFVFEDGTRHQKTWHGKEEKIRFRFVHSSPLSWVHIDPGYSMTLEDRHLNNYRRASIDNEQRDRWNQYVMNGLQWLFHRIGW